MKIQGSMTRGIIKNLGYVRGGFTPSEISRSKRLAPRSKNRSRFQTGFTIVEVIIVLGITGVLLASALILVRGQQNKTEFSQAINDIESQINDVMNDVATGFYPNTDNFTCTAGASAPLITSSGGGSAQQGKKLGCIFMGRALQFGVSGTSGSGFNNYTVVGLTQYNDVNIGLRDAATLSEARPTALAPASSSPVNFPDATVSDSLKYGLQITKINYFDSNNTAQSIAGFVFMGSLAVLSSGTGNLVSGSQHVDIVPITMATPGNTNATPTAFVDQVNTMGNNAVVNPPGGIVMCFKSGGTYQYGIITIGSNGRTLSTKLTILDSASATAPGGICA